MTASPSPNTPEAPLVPVEAVIKNLMDRHHFAGLARCKLSHAMENNRPAIELAQDHQAACKLLEDAIRTALNNPVVTDAEVYAAAELFSQYSDESIAFSLFRKMLESFAASRPAAPVAAVDAPMCTLGCANTAGCKAIRDGCGSECVAKPFQLRATGEGAQS